MKTPCTIILVAICVATLGSCARSPSGSAGNVPAGAAAGPQAQLPAGNDKLVTLRSDGADPLGHGVRERMRARPGEILVRFRKNTSPGRRALHTRSFPGYI